ncbi:MAG TPA: AAA family ATPase [Polyangiaceae bacterium]|nr:AAA family ATPase [Polyangiaceae bacterium]
MSSALLVGRDREVSAIEEGLAALDRGEGSLLMISGEPGIGKTRLLEELSRRATQRGARLGWGRMWEVGMTPAFFAWTQALSTLGSAQNPAPSLEKLEERAGAGARVARFGEVKAFLSRQAAEAPVVLLFDDVHAADPSSLQLLEYVTPLLGAERVLFALAARDADATPEVALLLGRIQRRARRLPLARLGKEEVQALVEGRVDGTRVFELSDGNPLFVNELVASQEPGKKLKLPALSSVRGVIQERVQRLPEPTRAALVAGAVVGREFRARVVGDMLGVESAEASLAPALALRMLEMTSPDRYRFSHALVAEALAEELEPAERARLHLRAAQAVERREGEDSMSVAHHLLSAGHLAAEAAVKAAERAARHCMERLAFEDAAQLLERALSALTLAEPNARRRRALLLCGRAESLQHATQHALAADLCDEALGIVRALDAEGAGPDAPNESNAELFARIALVRGLEFRFGRTDPLLVAVLREALGRLGERSTRLRARLLARLAAAEQPSRDPQGPVKVAFEAIELSRDLAPRDRLDVAYVATAALVDYVAPAELERIHHEVLELARGTDRWISVHTRLRLCFTATERIDRRALEAATHAFVTEADALALPQWQRYAPMLEALTANLEGRFADAECAAEECEAVSLAMGDTGSAWLLAIHRSMRAWVRTAPVDAETRAVVLDYVPGAGAIAAWFATQDGALEEARLALAQLGERMPLDPDLALMVGQAVAFAGTNEFRAQAYDLIAGRTGRIAIGSMVGFCVFDLCDRLLLVLSTALERWDLLEQHAEAALSIAARLGSPVWEARVQADFADGLTRRGREGDRARAQSLYAEALVVAERLEMPGLAARCRSARTEPVAAVRSAPASRPTPKILLKQSGALWLLSGFGEEVAVKDSRGMQMLARLLAEPGRELHALELAGATGETDGGDTGPALDARARTEYRARLAELTAERDEAESFGDRGRAERAAEEMEALRSELARAFGLGGRERKLGAASERARSNVQRRITHALEQVTLASARLGEHLTATVRTGTYCVYTPSA